MIRFELSVLENVEKVDVTGKSIGKGFQGTVKRWNFGRGPMAHGSKTTENLVQSVQVQLLHVLSKVKEWLVTWVTKELLLLKLKLVKVDSANGLVLVKGSVPGCEGRLVTIVPTRTKWN